MAIADKYYTKESIAKKCVDKVNEMFDLTNQVFLEPTAGNGAFLDYLPSFEAYDLIPEDKRITQLDILNFKSDKKDYITIGNPPFGKRSKLAIQVFNKCAEYSNIIAFIVPISFNKYNIQAQLSKDFSLIYSEKLPKYSFTDRDKDFDVNCVFQIWVRRNSMYDKYKDIRIDEKPPTSHEDFKIWQYNATEQSLNVINEDWEIAIYRQGYKDYNKKFYQKDKAEILSQMTGTKKQQFFFIKPLNEQARRIIEIIDFNSLALMNTTTPGFGKADFVGAYNILKDSV